MIAVSLVFLSWLVEILFFGCYVWGCLFVKDCCCVTVLLFFVWL